MNRAGVLASVVLAAAGCASAAPSEPAVPSRFELTADAYAAELMSGATPRLPAWARALAVSLPATTAHQVNLDFVQRTRNPLGPVLGAQVRWVVADAHRCEYAKRCAELDLAKAGVPADDVARLADLGSVPEPDRLALEFARKLTLAASSITDDEVAALIASCGPDDAVAIVHTVAYANFEDRILLALGLTTDADDRLVPQQLRPPREGELTVPARRPVADDGASATGAASSLPPWTSRTADELRDLVEQQKSRTARIADPGEVRLARLPRPVRKRMGRMAWGTVSVGYQPELTRAWFLAADSFQREAQMDDVFLNSVFWVVTRTNDCFY